MAGGNIEIVVIIAATGGLITLGLICIADALRAARVQDLVHQELWGDVPALPEEAKRAAPTPGGVADTARSQRIAHHIAHDRGAPTS